MRVFTLIELADRRIPTPGRFMEIYKELEHAFKAIYKDDQVAQMVGKPHLIGAVVIGSMARMHDMACTSDIDIVVFHDDMGVTDDQVRFWAQKYRSKFSGILQKAARCNVPVNIYNIYTEKLCKEDTRHTKQFLKHVRASIEGFGDPARSGLLVGDAERIVRIISDAPGFTRGAALRYMRDKREKLRDGYMSWGGLTQEAAARFYGTIFTCPFHAARQYLDCDGRGYVDTKAGVIAAIAKHASLECAALLQSLADAGSVYAKGCDVYRDDKTGERKQPTLDFEQLYVDAYQTLAMLSSLIHGWKADSAR